MKNYVIARKVIPTILGCSHVKAHPLTDVLDVGAPHVKKHLGLLSIKRCATSVNVDGQAEVKSAKTLA